MTIQKILQEAKEKGCQWIAQDKLDGSWYGFISKPKYYEDEGVWQSDSGYSFIKLTTGYEVDYSKQIFNVDAIIIDQPK